MGFVFCAGFFPAVSPVISRETSGWRQFLCYCLLQPA
jgi:hypothetical protein